MPFAFRCALLAVCCCGGIVVAEEAPPYLCRFASGPITLDGKADEAVWKDATTLDRFTQPWKPENPAATTATAAKLLWDREYLYFFAEMTDGDLYADIKDRDGPTWDNDVFELFFKPQADKPGYYEFQVTPAGTVLDMFLPRRDAGGLRRFGGDGDFAWETKVALRGTLNKWTDQDEGWSVEGRFPWKDFLRTGGRPEADDVWKFALCRYDYSVDFEGPALSTSAPLKSKPFPDFHRHEDYAALKFVGPTKLGGGPKLEALVAKIQSAAKDAPSKVVGSPDPPLPYRATRVRPELKPAFPIYVAVEPGTSRLLFIDQKWAYGPARLARTTDQAGELETLYEFPNSGVAYGITFHPKFRENGFVYVGWNGAVEGKEKKCFITRFTIERATGSFLQDSAKTILEWASDGHNGAAVAFDRDGMMLVTTGDGTSDSDTNVAGQGLDHLLSKLLRIDVDRPEAEKTYSVPKDNPFLTRAGVRPETFAYGFRNPWRITVDPKSGDIWVGQNGQDLFEQVYLVERGANYGWSVFEGSAPFYPERKLGPDPVTKPTLEHPHSESRSLTGGVVYHGAKLPELRGAYLYGDYSTGKIWAAKADRGKIVWSREIADTPLQLTCFELDADGELLICDHRAAPEGGLYTLEPNPPPTSAEVFPRKLSETGLFTSVAGHQVHPALIPYDVNAPLWSDGADKERFLYLPTEERDGARRLKTFELSSGDGGWNLPEGTITVKSFAFDTAQGKRYIETRLMVKQQNEWVGYSYAWNDEQTDAILVDGQGAERPIDVRGADGGVKSQVWRFPSRTECMICHSRAANYVLGLSMPQFNRSRDGIEQLELLEALGAVRVNWQSDLQAGLKRAGQTAGKSDAELDQQWKRLSETRSPRDDKRRSQFLTHSADQYPRLVDPYSPGELTARVKSYLHANCAHCHVEAGGGNAPMQLSWSTPLDKMKLLDANPVHHKFELPDAKIVAANDPGRSVLLHRVATNGRGRMPQIGVNVVDDRAVALLREWIRDLPPHVK